MFNDHFQYDVHIGGNWEQSKSRHYLQIVDENNTIPLNYRPLIVINAAISYKFKYS